MNCWYSRFIHKREKSSILYIVHNSTVIYAVGFVRHLGHIVGLKSQQRAVEGYVYDFNNKVNKLMSYFSCASSHTLNVLVSAYCMALHGICLWDLTSTHCERVYTTRRKTVWRITRFNPRAHNDLLHDIINVKPIKPGLYFLHVLLWLQWSKAVPGKAL